MLLRVTAGVGDDDRRLRGEHDQGFLVIRRKLPAALLLRQVDVAEALAPMADRGPQKGPHRRMAFGKADRLGVAGDIRQSQGFLYFVQVLEESQALGQVPQTPALLRGDAGGDEGLYAPGGAKGQKGAIASVGQQTGLVYDPLQHGIVVEIFGDAKAGFAQPGEAIPQRCNLSPQLVCFLKRDVRPEEYLRFCDSWLHVSEYTSRGTKVT